MELGGGHSIAITYHRQKRSKRQTASALDHIAGIGPKTREALLRALGSVKRIQTAGVEDIQAVVGKARGEKIYAAIHVADSDENNVAGNDEKEI